MENWFASAFFVAWRTDNEGTWWKASKWWELTDFSRAGVVCFQMEEEKKLLNMYFLKHTCLPVFFSFFFLFFWFQLFLVFGVFCLINWFAWFLQTKMEVALWRKRKIGRIVSSFDVSVFSSSSIDKHWDEWNWQVLRQLTYSVFECFVPDCDWPVFINTLLDVTSYMGFVNYILVFGSLWELLLYLILFTLVRRPWANKWIFSIVTHSWHLLVYPFYSSERLSSCMHRRDFP